MHVIRALVLQLLFLCVAQAQTTGSLVGTVFDEDGLEIPGVAVTLTGPTLAQNGLRSTDATGGFRFSALPPGSYTVTAVRGGFKRVAIRGVLVAIGRTTTQNVVMRLAGGEEVVCSGGSGIGPRVNDPSWPVRQPVDVQSTTASQQLTKDFLERIPAGRSYAQSVRLASSGRPGSGSQPNSAGPRIEPRQALVVRTPAPFSPPDRPATFAADVDTGSYHRAMAWLAAGRRPDPSEIRVEAFVNAQTYALPAPPPGRPFLAVLDAAPSPWNPDLTLLRVAVQAEEQEDRPPLGLTLLVDVSCSMSGQKLLDAQVALHDLVDRLDERDHVAVVTFSSTAQTVQRPRLATDSAVRSAIDRLTITGGTHLHRGLQEAWRAADRLRDDRPEHAHHVVLFSDGGANQGVVTTELIAEAGRRLADHGLGLSTVGVGLDGYRDDVLERLANRADGAHVFLGGAHGAKEAMNRVLGMAAPVAKDVKLQVRFDPDAVRGWRQVGYDNRRISAAGLTDDRVDGGEMGPAHQVTALFELQLRGGAAGESLAALHIQARVGGARRSSAWTAELPSLSVQRAFAEAPVDLRRAGLAALAARCLATGAAWPATPAETRRWTDGLPVDPLTELVESLASSHVAP